MGAAHTGQLSFTAASLPAETAVWPALSSCDMLQPCMHEVHTVQPQYSRIQRLPCASGAGASSAQIGHARPALASPCMLRRA